MAADEDDAPPIIVAPEDQVREAVPAPPPDEPITESEPDHEADPAPEVLDSWLKLGYFAEFDGRQIPVDPWVPAWTVMNFSAAVDRTPFTTGWDFLTATVPPSYRTWIQDRLKDKNGPTANDFIDFIQEVAVKVSRRPTEPSGA